MRRKRTRFRFNEADLRSRSRERPRASSPLAEHRRRVRAPLRLETTWARALALETWTAEHVRQGFAWRPGSVSFRTLEEAGEIDIAVSLTHAVDELGSTAARIIDVPFTVPESGDIEVACITAGFPLALPSGACSLRFEHGIGKDQRMWAKLCFHPATTVVTPRIVRADAELMSPAVLLMEVLPA